MGWPRDYAMVRASTGSARPPLHEQDYEGFVEPGSHGQPQRRRSPRSPSRGVIVACPHLPDVRPATDRRRRRTADSCSTCCCRACAGRPRRSPGPSPRASTACPSGASSRCASGWRRRRRSAAVERHPARRAGGAERGLDRARPSRRAPVAPASPYACSPATTTTSTTASWASRAPGAPRAWRTTSRTSQARTTTSSTGVPGRSSSSAGTTVSCRGRAEAAAGKRSARARACQDRPMKRFTLLALLLPLLSACAASLPDHVELTPQAENVEFAYEPPSADGYRRSARSPASPQGTDTEATTEARQERSAQQGRRAGRDGRDDRPEPGRGRAPHQHARG